jgi:hypothetical protein
VRRPDSKCSIKDHNRNERKVLGEERERVFEKLTFVIQVRRLQTDLDHSTRNIKDRDRNERDKVLDDRKREDEVRKVHDEAQQLELDLKAAWQDVRRLEEDNRRLLTQNHAYTRDLEELRNEVPLSPLPFPLPVFYLFAPFCKRAAWPYGRSLEHNRRFLTQNYAYTPDLEALRRGSCYPPPLIPLYFVSLSLFEHSKQGVIARILTHLLIFLVFVHKFC